MYSFLRIICRLAVLALFLTAARTASAQIQGMQPFENRLEGTKVRPNALLDFTLIAAHKTFQPFSSNAVLHVRFFLPQANTSAKKEVSIESAELQDSFHYSMQGKNTAKWKDGDWNIFEPWPTRDVIDKLGLQSTNIGVLVSYRVGNSPPVYLPADVYQHGDSSRVGVYTFYFITGQNLQSLDVSVTNSAGAILKVPKVQLICKVAYNPDCILYAAGSVHPITLDMSTLPQGEYHIKLLGRKPGDLTPTSLDVVVYHHP